MVNQCTSAAPIKVRPSAAPPTIRQRLALPAAISACRSHFAAASRKASTSRWILALVRSFSKADFAVAALLGFVAYKLTFSAYALELDRTNKRIRKRWMFFGLGGGEWFDLDKFDTLEVLDERVSMETGGRFARQTRAVRTYEVRLRGPGQDTLVLKEFIKQQKARKFARSLLPLLNLKLRDTLKERYDKRMANKSRRR